MATAPIWGPEGSITTSGFGCHFNAFTFSMAQGVTGYFGFGDTWMQNYGTIASWSVSLAGFTTKGSTTDQLVVTPITTRAGVSITLTWTTSCTVAGTVVVTANDNNVTFLGTDSTSYNGVGTAAPTISWVTA